ncbi:MAG: T9SS type A sorting domain-containing protein [Bacteroidetes bacterium]|nr:T9SS type A sorting domain-containing protein [Bacteroidota bacterium]
MKTTQPVYLFFIVFLLVTLITSCFLSTPRHAKIMCPTFGGGGGNSLDWINPMSGVYGNIPIEPGVLTAGELNDFSKWNLWKDITGDDLSVFQEGWAIVPKERYVVQVTNEDHRPVLDASITIFSDEGNIIWRTRTDNTGKAELWANLFGDSISPSYFEVHYNDKSYRGEEIKKFERGINFIEIPVECHVPNQLDILFAVDATGSMGDEINYLKEELNNIITETKEKNPSLNIKMGSLFYRCIGNSYVTRKSGFSTDIGRTASFIKNQEAGEGGVEAVEVALEESISHFEWSEDANARLLFLILDEPPGSEPAIIKQLQRAVLKAAEKGIRIIPVVASGTGLVYDKRLEYLMRSIALATNGTYVFLTNHSGVGNAHTDPTTDEFDVEHLNKLLMRLIQQFAKAPSCEENYADYKNGISDTTLVEIIEHVVLDSTMIAKGLDSTLVTSTLEQVPVMSVRNEETFDNPIVKFIHRNDKPVINKSFKFYPNPTQGRVTVEIEGEINELYLSDMNGKLLERYTFVDQQKKEIDISRYATGLYFLQYENQGKWFTGKILLVKE